MPLESKNSATKGEWAMWWGIFVVSLTLTLAGCISTHVSNHGTPSTGSPAYHAAPGPLLGAGLPIALLVRRHVLGDSTISPPRQ